MNVFNSILNGTREIFNNKDNYFNIYLFGIVGYNMIETYKDSTYYLNKYRNGDLILYKIYSDLDSIYYGANKDWNLRLAESLWWPLGLIRQWFPLFIHELHREKIINVNINKEKFYEEYDSIDSDITIEKDE